MTAQRSSAPVSKVVKSIPTLYNDVRYRSRLEARWAVFFDRMKWPHAYEPVDLRWYIPDFVLRFAAGPIAVEVKPASSLEELRSFAPKMMRAGWHGEILLLGSALHHVNGAPVLGLLGEPVADGEFDLGPAQVFACLNHGGPSILHPDSSWHCRVCGAHDRRAHIGELSIAAVAREWAESGNRVQWRPEP